MTLLCMILTKIIFLHQIVFYNKINSLNKLNFNTPLDNLLNIFSKNYISKKQLKIFDCGIYAVKFLNRYFKTF